MKNSLPAITGFLQSISEYTGRATAWLVPLMALIVVYDVSMRAVFQEGSVGLQELEWHLFAIIFLIGAAYTFKHDSHVRLEIFYQRFSERTRAWIEIAGTLLVLLPLCILIIKSSIPFVENAYNYNEHSPDPGGLQYRFLIKAAIPAGFLLLALQGIASLLRAISVLTRNGESGR